MKNKIEFQVFGEPHAKQRARVYVNKYTNRACAYTPKETVTYESLIAGTVYKYRPKGGLITGPVSLNLRIYRSIPKSMSKKNRLLAEEGKLLPVTKPDMDNIIKSVFDALNDVIWHDDSQVVELICSKGYSNTPRIEVEIEWEALGLEDK